MSLESTGAYEQRLLPAAIEDRLVGWFGRTAGAVLLTATAALWAAIITWSIADPSLTHATGGTAGNALGIPGAIISDLMLQTLGLGALLALLPPMLWSVELLAAQRIRDFRAKASFYPLAVLILAGGISALPVAAGWPLKHGYGGILGDLIYGLAAGGFGVLNPDRGRLAGGLVLFAGGGAALLTAIGVEIKDLAALVSRRRQSFDPTPFGYGGPELVPTAPARQWLAWPFGRGGRVSTQLQMDNPAFGGHFAPANGQLHGAEWNGHWQHGPHAAIYPAHHAGPGSQAAYGSGHGYATQYPAMLDPAAYGRDTASSAFIHPVPLPGSRADRSPGSGPEAHPGAAYGPHLDTHRAGLRPAPQLSPSHPRDYDVHRPSLDLHAPETDELAGRDPEFDLSTDAASRSIAERFAPNGGGRPAANAVPAPGAATTAAHPVPSAAAPRNAGPKPGSGLLAGMSFRRAEPQYRRPSLNLLRRPSAQKLAADHTPAMQRGTARLLEDVLADFGVKGEIKDIRPGPVVTLFEFEPARGTKSSRVIGLADDIARSMSATAVRVAIVPGRNAIGIELPNARRETVLLRELLEADAFRSADAALPITLGKSIGGEPVIADLARMPHLLVAGTTGSGKSVGVNTMILSLLFRHSPEDCRFLMIDPKMLELSVYNGIPHLLAPVVTDPQKAVAALNWAVREMEERYKRMSQLSVRNIEVFNNRVRNAKKRGELMSRTVQTGFDSRTGQPVFEEERLALEPLPYIVIVVDEFADLMVVAGKDIEAAVQRLAQMARAAGIHLIMATQRPSVDIVTGTIKANFPTRISFKVASKIDSRTILNDQGAEQLLGQGDMLYAGSTGGQPVRVHGAFVADDEVEAIVSFLKSQGTPRYVDGVTDVPQGADVVAGAEPSGSDDDLYDRAVAVVLRDGKASTSYVQRRLSIGYNRAADLIERMEREGLIGPANSVGKRDILAGRDGGREATGSHAA